MMDDLYKVMCFQSADAMEIMLLSILGPALACEWLINKWEMAFLSTVVFIGWSLGGPFWGKFCDQYGRRMVTIHDSNSTVDYLKT